MTWFNRHAARAAAVAIFLGTAFALPASAQRVQDITPLPAAAPQAAEPASPPAAETAGPRVREDLPRIEPSPSSAYSMKKKDSVIRLSTVALVLLVVVVVLLVT